VDRLPPDAALERLLVRLWRFTGEGDPRSLVDDNALVDAQAVFKASVEADQVTGKIVVLDRKGATVVAMAHWYRYIALPKGLCEYDLIESQVLLRLLGCADIDELAMDFRIEAQGGPVGSIGLDSLDAAVKWAHNAVARFDAAGDRAAVDEAMGHLRARIAVFDGVEPRLPPLLDALGPLLVRKFIAEPARLSWIEEAVAVARRSVELTSADDPSLDDRRQILGVVLGRHATATGRLSPPQEALDLLRQLVACTPQDHPRQAGRLTELGRLLLHAARPDSAFDAALNAEAISLLSRALATGDHSERVDRLVLYAEALIQRGHVQPAMLPEAIAAQREVTDSLPAQHRDRGAHLGRLGNLLVFAARQGNSRQSLNEAITLLRSAVKTSQPSQRGPILLAMSAALNGRYEHTGDPSDLDQALSAARESVDLAPVDDPDSLEGKASLAAALLRRFEHLHGRSDLAEALPLLREVASGTASGDPQMLPRLANLAVALSWSAEQYGVSADLDEAFQIYDRVLPGLTENPRADLLSSFAVALAKRGRPKDLDDAVESLREAVELTPDGHPRRPIRLANLGTTLQVRAERHNDSTALNEAVLLYRQALARLDPDHPDRAWLSGDLGQALVRRFARTHHPKDRTDAIEALRASVGHLPAPAAIRGRAALVLGRFGADTGDADTALAGFGGAVDLLPTLAWRGNTRADQEHLLGQWRTLANDAAAWAIAAGETERAVDLVERGRYVLWSQELELRAELSRLKAAAPELHERLTEVRDRLLTESSTRSDRTGNSGSVALLREWEGLVDRARTIPGFEGLGRLPEVPELTRTLGDGTAVIINVSRYRCDALLVRVSGVTSVTLPGLTDEEVTERAHMFLGALMRLDARPALGEKVQLLELLRETLDWLWSVAAKPVLDELELSGGQGSRVWWSPTGLLSVLPVHAAGAFDGTAGASVLDRVVSSYAGSLRVLAHARRRGPGPALEHSVLMVAVPEAGDLPVLHGVTDEIDAIGRLIPGSSAVIAGASASKANVLSALLEYQVVHFACHATQDPVNPGDGGIILHDGKLGFEAIAAAPGGAELAFLSACRTGLGAIDVPDEALHVVAGFQVAGFRHVIGTCGRSRTIRLRSSPKWPTRVWSTARDWTRIGQRWPCMRQSGGCAPVIVTT
jgi:tetratricopeptide (TPR) repeat protein